MDDCPNCDGSGLVWVALDSDGEVAREQCPLCDQLRHEEKKNGNTYIEQKKQ